MNKLGRDGAQVFANIQEEKTSTVYGYLYRITERAEKYLNKREGFPVHYAKKIESDELIKNVPNSGYCWCPEVPYRIIKPIPHS